jgi:transketolase
MPNVTVFRPADAWETAVGWQVALARRTGPTALALTRQKLPLLPRSAAAGAARGGYVLADAENPQLILLATGSEVHIALDAREQLQAEGVAARVVSMPSWELFEQQPAAYRESVLPPAVTQRIAIEAGVTFGWERYVGAAGTIIGIDRFGASAPYQRVYQEFGLTAASVVAAARQLLTER